MHQKCIQIRHELSIKYSTQVPQQNKYLRRIVITMVHWKYAKWDYLGIFSCRGPFIATFHLFPQERRIPTV